MYYIICHDFLSCRSGAIANAPPLPESDAAFLTAYGKLARAVPPPPTPHQGPNASESIQYSSPLMGQTQFADTHTQPPMSVHIATQQRAPSLPIHSHPIIVSPGNVNMVPTHVNHTPPMSVQIPTSVHPNGPVLHPGSAIVNPFTPIPDNSVLNGRYPSTMHATHAPGPIPQPQPASIPHTVPGSNSPASTIHSTTYTYPSTGYAYSTHQVQSVPSQQPQRTSKDASVQSTLVQQPQRTSKDASSTVYAGSPAATGNYTGPYTAPPVHPSSQPVLDRG